MRRGEKHGWNMYCIRINEHGEINVDEQDPRNMNSSGKHSERLETGVKPIKEHADYYPDEEASLPLLSEAPLSL